MRADMGRQDELMPVARVHDRLRRLVQLLIALFFVAGCSDPGPQLVLAEESLEASGPDSDEGLIRIDQFGYRPADPKVAVIASSGSFLGKPARIGNSVDGKKTVSL